MADIKIWTECSGCFGSGIKRWMDNLEERIVDPCTNCGGSGKLSVSELDGTKINNMKDKIDQIWDKVKNL
jgi:DnaJ-class molecular chaperone